MTKKEYIDWMRNNVSRIDKTARYHPKQVEYAIEKVFNQVYYDLALKSPNSLDRYSIELTGVSSVDGTAANGRWYADLTKDYVDLPFKTSGVLEVRLPSTTTLAFVPMTSMEMDQAYGADLTLGSTIIGFSAHNGKVEFFGMTAEATTLVIKIVPLFSEYVDADEVYPPFGKDLDITGQVMQILSNIPPVDLTNDNSNVSYGKQK